MNHYFPQLVFGYHGCDREVGEAVLLGKSKLATSKNSYDWLGHGIYFWESAPNRAFEWAQICSQDSKLTKGKIKEPFVLGAIIDLGNCFDLTDVHDVETFKNAFGLVKDLCRFTEKPIPKNTNNNKALDCIVINTVMTQRSYDTVRGAFIEGDPLFPGATLYDKTHIQICVRNDAVIKGYFWVHS